MAEIKFPFAPLRLCVKMFLGFDPDRAGVARA